MRCGAGFFMGNSLSDPKDLLIPFVGTDRTGSRLVLAEGIIAPRSGVELEHTFRVLPFLLRRNLFGKSPMLGDLLLFDSI
jgi:hypothetical protein